MSDGPTLLVLGAQSGGSLGAAIATMAEEAGFGMVVTAGLRDEEFHCDARRANDLKEAYELFKPDYVVCTIAVNNPTSTNDQFLRSAMLDSFDANVVAPMEALRLFRHAPRAPGHSGRWLRKFVAISSNSARIPRTQSAPYCASKAALSMALRVAARELARTDEDILVWGYEPGLLAGTPMTQQSAATFTGPLHRMPGVSPEGIPPSVLALKVIDDLAHSSVALHGVMVPFDAGEL